MQNDNPVRPVAPEILWRGTLTPDQRQQLEVWLSQHPGERDLWQEQAALTRLLARLPEGQAPSNLTARVMSAIDLPVQQTEPVVAGGILGWLRKMGWVPRLAGVAVLVMVGYVGHHQYQLTTRRAEMARNVAEVTELATTMPSLEALQDFDAIRNLESAAAPDTELLALLQ